MRPIATTRSATGTATGKLAVWWVLASEVVIFGGLLASYVMHRLGHPEWADAAVHTNTAIGAFNTFVLLTSSLTAVLAHQAAERGDGKTAAKFLYFTMVGAATFVGVRPTSGGTRSRRLYDYIQHLLGVLLLRRRPSRISRDRGRGDHGLRGQGRREGPRAPPCRADRDLLHFVDNVWIFLLPPALHR